MDIKKSRFPYHRLQLSFVKSPQINTSLIRFVEYESVFEAKSFNGELEIAELTDFFKDCDLFPSKTDIKEAMDLIYRGRKSIPSLLTVNSLLVEVIRVY